MFKYISEGINKDIHLTLAVTVTTCFIKSVKCSSTPTYVS